MNTLSKNQLWTITAMLLLVMIVTRTHLINHIQDASWAVFFLLGFYIRKVIAFPIFWLVAFAVDLIVIESKGGQSYCFTISYPFLIPAYASLWFAGRWFAKHYSENLRGLLYFVGSAVVGIAICDMISSGGFYFFSGRFADVNISEFAGRLATYMPMFMKTTLLYLSIAAVVHLAFVQASKFSSKLHHS